MTPSIKEESIQDAPGELPLSIADSTPKRAPRVRRGLRVVVPHNLKKHAPLDAGQTVPDPLSVARTPGGGRNWRGVHIFPVSEVDYSRIPDMDPFYSSEAKSLPLEAFPYFCPAPLPDAVTAEAMRLATETFRVTQSLDFARVDFRLHTGENLKPYILEINSLPGLTPISDLTPCALAEGWSYNRLIPSVLEAGARRYGLMGETDAGTMNGEKKNYESAQA